MQTLWTDVLLPFLVSYGTSILTAIVIGLVIGLFSMSTMVVKKINEYLKSLADKHLTEKIAIRVKEALDKVQDVLLDLIALETNTIKDMAQKAMENDGKIDMNEVKEIAKKIVEIAIEKLTVESKTLQKYVTGQSINAFLEDKVSALISQSIEKMISSKMGKLENSSQSWTKLRIKSLVGA